MAGKEPYISPYARVVAKTRQNKGRGQWESASNTHDPLMGIPRDYSLPAEQEESLSSKRRRQARALAAEVQDAQQIEGLSVRALAKRFHITTRTVQRYLKRD